MLNVTSKDVFSMSTMISSRVGLDQQKSARQNFDHGRYASPKKCSVWNDLHVPPFAIGFALSNSSLDLLLVILYTQNNRQMPVLSNTDLILRFSFVLRISSIFLFFSVYSAEWLCNVRMFYLYF